MYRKYRMIEDLAIADGGYIRETRIARRPLSKSYVGTARIGDLSARIIVKFYRHGGSRIIGPATDAESDRHAFDDLVRYMDGLEKDEKNGYRALLKRRSALRAMFINLLAALTLITTRSIWIAGTTLDGTDYLTMICELFILGEVTRLFFLSRRL